MHAGMKIAVAGATGRVGRHVVAVLFESGALLPRPQRPHDRVSRAVPE